MSTINYALIVLAAGSSFRSIAMPLSSDSSVAKEVLGDFEGATRDDVVKGAIEKLGAPGKILDKTPVDVAAIVRFADSLKPAVDPGFSLVSPVDTAWSKVEETLAAYKASTLDSAAGLAAILAAVSPLVAPVATVSPAVVKGPGRGNWGKRTPKVQSIVKAASVGDGKYNAAAGAVAKAYQDAAKKARCNPDETRRCYKTGMDLGLAAQGLPARFGTVATAADVKWFAGFSAAKKVA